jgi:hypothetical protein
MFVFLSLLLQSEITGTISDYHMVEKYQKKKQNPIFNVFTVSHCQLGLFQIANFQVAVLDIDICGPSQPRVLGVLNEQVHQSGSGWSPVVGFSQSC